MPPPGTPNQNTNPNQNPNINLDPMVQAAIDLSRNIDSARGSLEDTVDITKNLARELKRSSEVLRTSFEFSTEVKHALNDARAIASKLGRDYIDQQIVQERINTNLSLQEVIQSRIDDLVGKVNTKNLTEADLIKDINNRIGDKSKKIRNTVTDQEIALVNYFKEKEAVKTVVNELGNVSDKVSESNNKVKEMQLKASALARIFQSITGIPFLKDFMDFKKISDAFNISSKAGMVAFGEEIGRVVKSPLFKTLLAIVAIIAAIKALVKIAFDFDKQLVQISNNLGFARDASLGILNNFRNISVENLKSVGALDSAFLSVKNQVAATAELQDSLETNSLFTNDMVQNQILLTKQLKLSKEESAGIQKLSLLSGKSADEILQNAISQNKTAISYKKIISDISKVSSEISVMYKNNPDLISKAVIEANKLGMSLEQTQKISKSLLDFESSISNELEAELLIGKSLNFERARALALDGKSVEAAKELVGQMGGLEGLTKLNVIQRDRLANSIGQTAEDLTKSAREQEILNKLGFENKKALEEQYELLRSRNDQAGIAALMEEARKKEGGEVLLQDIARVNLQERFQESVERIKQIFTELAAGPMIKLLEGIAKFLQNTTALKILFASLVGLATAIAAAITIATGGANLVAAGLIGGAAALGTFALLSGGTPETSETPVTRSAPNSLSKVEPVTPSTTEAMRTPPPPLPSNSQNNQPSNGGTGSGESGKDAVAKTGNVKYQLFMDGREVTVTQKLIASSYA
jgi:hypothetical protein